jgi:erythromycin esterase
MKKILLFLTIFLFLVPVFTVNAVLTPEEHIRKKSIEFSDNNDLDPLISAASQSQLVLLGEASHGTHEYYTWRDSISRRLISEHGFQFIAVEGDFASLYELNRYVKDLPGAASSARQVLEKLNRWPQWMWGNHEIVALAEWLRSYNENMQPDARVGFYGMDVYDEWNSKKALQSFLKENNTHIYEHVKEQYNCFNPYSEDSWAYARAVAAGRDDCSVQAANVVKILEDSRINQFQEMSDDEFFYALQNAHVKKNAEKFFRKSTTRQDASAWNARVHHMHETIIRLLTLYGENSKGIVWAHNTHIGDSRFTEMNQHGQLNIGALSREYLGPENVFLIGFTTYKGTVKAGRQWGGKRREMNIPPAQDNSIEALLEKANVGNMYLVFDDNDRTHVGLTQPMGNRAVGVVYNPVNEPRQYVMSIVPLRYDALFFFRETRALKPLQ